MREAEICRRNDRRRPETDARREREYPVSTSAELFSQTDKDENERVDDGPFPYIPPVQCDASKIEDSSDSHSNQQTGDGGKAEQNAQPELNAEHPAPGQTVIGNGPAFDTPHNPTGEEKDEEIDD